MRNAISLFALCGFVAAQEPVQLTTNPPVQTTQFGATALGAGTTEVAQIQLTFDPSVSTPTWYLSATVHQPSSTFWQPYSGTVTGTPGAYVVTSNTDYSLVPPPTTDYFAANVSSDLQVMVTDTGAATPPGVFVRTGTTGNFVPFGSIPAPVPATYNDSQMGDTITPWNGTTGTYEYIFISGTNIAKTTITLTAPSTVTVGSTVTIVTSAVQKHSPCPIRQWSGLPSDWGVSRALIYSQNDSSADSYFKSALFDDASIPITGTLTYDDANWKANPGNIGGATYWAYAMTGYVDPLQEDICCMSSAHVAPTGGPVTICAWNAPSTSPKVGFVMLGTLQSPGLNLGLPFITGKLGINPVGLVFLSAQPFDANNGEISYSFVTGRLPIGRIDMQVGCFDLVANQIFLGNTAQLTIL
ncbi:MAG: hypothetical protein R3F56_06665 [Planctomycetota bacterium]